MKKGTEGRVFRARVAGFVVARSRGQRFDRLVLLGSARGTFIAPCAYRRLGVSTSVPNDRRPLPLVLLGSASFLPCSFNFSKILSASACRCVMLQCVPTTPFSGRYIFASIHRHQLFSEQCRHRAKAIWGQTQQPTRRPFPQRMRYCRGAGRQVKKAILGLWVGSFCSSSAGSCSNTFAVVQIRIPISLISRRLSSWRHSPCRLNLNLRELESLRTASNYNSTPKFLLRGIYHDRTALLRTS